MNFQENSNYAWMPNNPHAPTCISAALNLDCQKPQVHTAETIDLVTCFCNVSACCAMTLLKSNSSTHNSAGLWFRKHGHEFEQWLPPRCPYFLCVRSHIPPTKLHMCKAGKRSTLANMSHARLRHNMSSAYRSVTRH